MSCCLILLGKNQDDLREKLSVSCGEFERSEAGMKSGKGLGGTKRDGEGGKAAERGWNRREKKARKCTRELGGAREEMERVGGAKSGWERRREWEGRGGDEKDDERLGVVL